MEQYPPVCIIFTDKTVTGGLNAFILSDNRSFNMSAALRRPEALLFLIPIEEALMLLLTVPDNVLSAREIVRQAREVSLPWILRRTGVCLLLKRAFWRNRTAILFYEDPCPATLDAHLTHFKHGAKIIPVSHVCAPSNGPRAVTAIEDGMASNAKLKRVCERHDVRPALDVCTGTAAIGSGYWWLGLQRSLIERLKLVPKRERKRILKEPSFDEKSKASPRETMSLL